MSEIIVIGLGNPFFRDEGIGPRLLSELKNSHDDKAGIKWADAGTASLKILHLLAGEKKALIIDCAFMGSEPGTLKCFTFEEARSKKRLGGHSLHEGDLMNTLKLAKDQGELPNETVIFGIEPASIEFGNCLSPTLSSNIPLYLDIIGKELVLPH